MSDEVSNNQVELKHWEGVFLLGFVTMTLSVGFELLFGYRVRMAMLGLGFLGVMVPLLVNLPQSLRSVTVWVCLAGFALIEGLSFVQGHNVFDGRILVFRVMCYLIFLSGLSVQLFEGKVFSRPILQCAGYLCFAAVAVSVVGLRGFDISQGGRFTGSENMHSVGLSYSFGLGGVVAAYLAIANRSLLARIASIIAMTGCLFVLFVSGSRGGLLSSLAGILLVFAYAIWNGQIRNKDLAGVLAAALVGVLISSFYLAGKWAYVEERVLYVFERFEGAIDNQFDNSISERYLLNRVYFSDIENLFPFGYWGYSNDYPHNIFLEFVVRWGIFGILLGLALYALFAFSVFLPLKKRNKTNSVMLLFLALFAFSFINGQFNLSLEFNRGMWFPAGFFLAVALRSPFERDDIS
ncbi:hypothetical protein [Pelagicoccus sp. SDUM812002]|uniref:O-antigen ligase family protein n=1 Tax=Pelagicoccus sp. SDUM812002 TaxID=3041266 RepID=UPI00280CB3B6|nr:hypothetical protein [Pelagicoccus sp. SDUM812002]MDQ8188174.1 hypothetical protein [Pelagicoccus sp. SDUM812002]